MPAKVNISDIQRPTQQPFLCIFTPNCRNSSVAHYPPHLYKNARQNRRQVLKCKLSYKIFHYLKQYAYTCTNKSNCTLHQARLCSKKHNPSRDDPEQQQLFLRKWVLGGHYYY